MALGDRLMFSLEGLISTVTRAPVPFHRPSFPWSGTCILCSASTISASPRAGEFYFGLGLGVPVRERQRRSSSARPAGPFAQVAGPLPGLRRMEHAWSRSPSEPAAPAEYSFPTSEALLYKDIKEFEKPRIQVGIEEFNKVLGGGVVLGISRSSSAGSPASASPRSFSRCPGISPSMARGCFMYPARNRSSRSSCGATGWASGRRALSPGRDEPGADHRPGGEGQAQGPRRGFRPDGLSRPSCRRARGRSARSARWPTRSSGSPRKTRSPLS